MTKYPFEVCAIKRKTKTLAIMAHFTKAKASEDDTPLAVYDSKFSRLAVSVIDTESTSARANIPVSALEAIFKKTDYAFDLQMRMIYEHGEEKASEKKTSPAYTVAIASGLLKGKTPAKVLLEEKEQGKEALKKQYDWLKANLEKYPKNAVQMEAIAEAVKLYGEGRLSTEAAKNANARTVEVYRAPARALIRKERADGMCPVHDLRICWNVDEQGSVTIAVANYYAPVIRRDDGTISPQTSACDRNSIVKISITVTVEEWLNAIRSVKSAMHQFETVNAKLCIEDAIQTDAKNRAEAGLAKA